MESTSFFTFFRDTISDPIRATVFVLTSLAVYILLVSLYRLTLHPLAQYPGPLRYKLSDLPLVYQCYKGNRHLVHLRDHEKYGSVVRITPNSLSFSSSTALHQIYGSKAVNVRKSAFYETLDSGAGGFTTHTEIDKEKHAARRRILNHAFSDSALKEAETFVLSNVTKFVRLIGPQGNEKVDGWSETRNMSTWNNWLSYDIMGHLAFGKSYNCLEDEEHRRMPVILTEGTKFGYGFAYLPFAWLLRPLETSPLMQWIGGQTAKDNAVLVEYAMDQFEQRVAAEKKGDIRRKDFMHYLFNNADSKTGRRATELELKGDTLSIIGAGADTVATTLSAAFFYFVRNPSALERATKEVRRVFTNYEEIHTGPALQSCSFLNACIEETLRLNPPVASSLPREVMKGGIVIDGHHVPEGTVVGVPAYVLQHDPSVFPDPWTFNPDRWIIDSRSGVTREAVSAMQSAMLPFSVGSRGCIGKRLAYIELRLTLASVLCCYDMKEVAGLDGKKIGGGGNDLEWGRHRDGEFQIHDCFGADRDGPLIQFKNRED